MAGDRVMVRHTIENTKKDMPLQTPNVSFYRGVLSTACLSHLAHRKGNVRDITPCLSDPEDEQEVLSEVIDINGPGANNFLVKASNGYSW